jgi:hypothetical protein
MESVCLRSMVTKLCAAGTHDNTKQTGPGITWD